MLITDKKSNMKHAIIPKLTCTDENGKTKPICSSILAIRTTIMNSFQIFLNQPIYVNIGYLSQAQFMVFINQARRSLYLSEADPKIQEHIFKMIDPSDTDKITYERLFNNFERIVHHINRPGKFTEKLINRLFLDFDGKRKGFLEIADLRCVFGL